MIWNSLKHPIKLLAPMAGYTDSVFRQICLKFGANVVMTELISADAIYYALKKSKQRLESSKSYDLMRFEKQEHPIVIQLFGKDPEKFLAAGRYIQDVLKADGIDINMGCSVRKVLKSGHGAALLQNQGKAIEIVKTLSENLTIPISVKTRLGFADDDQILEFGPKMADAGAKAIIIHGRTVKDGFKGLARWEPIYQLKKQLPNTIIIGNGDIGHFSEIKVKIGNLDGVAIGRAALGRPWIFSRESIPLSEIIKLANNQAKLAEKLKGEHGIIELRKHLLWYFKGLENASEIRKLLVQVTTADEVNKILKDIRA